MNKDIKMSNITVKPVEIQTQEYFAIPQGQDAAIVLFALVEALSREVMSSDVWWLANHSAKQRAIQKYGISEEVYDEVMEKIEKARQQVRKTNPMHTMF